MNTLSLIRHLLLKDLRALRPGLAVYWIFAVAVPFAMLGENAETWSHHPLIMLVTYSLFLVAGMILGQVILLDPPGREFHFLGTRPVTGIVLLASKVLFIAVFLLLPIWIAQVETLFLMKIPVNTLDVVLLLVEITIYAGAMFAAAALLPLFIRSFPVMLALLICLALAITAGVTFVHSRWFFTTQPWNLNYGLAYSRCMVFCVGTVATSLAAAIFRYQRGSRMKTAGVIALGILASTVAWRIWPFDLSYPFSGKMIATGELPASMRDKVKLTPFGKDRQGDNIVQGIGQRDGEDSKNYSHDFSFEGIEAPYFATMVDYHAEVTLKSGNKIVSNYHDINNHGQVGGFNDELEKKMVGIAPREETHPDRMMLEILNYLPGHYEKEDLSNASIKGTLTLEICKLVLVKTVPFKVGESVDIPLRHYLLKDAGFVNERVHYTIIMNGVRASLRGVEQGLDNRQKLSMLLYRPGINEWADAGGGGASAGDGFFCHVDSMRGAYSYKPADWEGPGEFHMSPDWVKDARISFFTTEPAGRITIPYEINDVTLKH